MEYHRQGLGRSLVSQAEEWAIRRAMAHLSVKTLGPSPPDTHYAMTGRFYEPALFARTPGVAVEDSRTVWARGAASPMTSRKSPGQPAREARIPCKPGIGKRVIGETGG